MKQVLFCLLGILLIAGTTTPESASAQLSGSETEEAHNALRVLKNGAEAAFNEMGRSGKVEDLNKILEYVHDDVVLAAMNGSLVVGKQGIVDYFKRTMTGPDRTVESVQHSFEVSDLTRLYGGDTGVAYGTTTGTYELTDGTQFVANAIWTATMVRENGNWLLASFQFAPSIFDNPILPVMINKAAWYGIPIVIVLLIAAFFLGRWTARSV